jgi:hypothetical protein
MSKEADKFFVDTLLRLQFLSNDKACRQRRADGTVLATVQLSQFGVLGICRWQSEQGLVYEPSVWCARRRSRSSRAVSVDLCWLSRNRRQTGITLSQISGDLRPRASTLDNNARLEKPPFRWVA